MKTITRFFGIAVTGIVIASGFAQADPAQFDFIKKTDVSAMSRGMSFCDFHVPETIEITMQDAENQGSRHFEFSDNNGVSIPIDMTNVAVVKLRAGEIRAAKMDGTIEFYDPKNIEFAFGSDSAENHPVWNNARWQTEQSNNITRAMSHNVTGTGDVNLTYFGFDFPGGAIPEDVDGSDVSISMTINCYTS